MVVQMSDFNEATSIMCEDFCQELSGVEDTSFHRTYGGNPTSRVIGRTPSLTLLADLSPLCVGHLLLVSNRHYLNFAQVVQDHHDEVAEATDSVLALYARTFGLAAVLEHGSVPDVVGSACITHAHWHLLPVDGALVGAQMDADGLDHVDLHDLRELEPIADLQLPYFYLAYGEYHQVYGIGRVMRSQYLRSVVGRILGIPDPEWDWALVIRRQALRLTMEATRAWKVGG
jgi:diadenosine tetraphosphate (Ap4A) HIT family hydrolase